MSRAGRQGTTTERAEQQEEQQQQPAKPVAAADDPERAKDFMLLLKQLDPPVTPKSRWSKVPSTLHPGPELDHFQIPPSNHSASACWVAHCLKRIRGRHAYEGSTVALACRALAAQLTEYDCQLAQPNCI